MIEVRFEVDGQSVEPASMKPGLQRSMLSVIRDALEEQVGEVDCCPHGDHPRILCKGPSVVEMSMEIHACCDDMLHAVAQRLH